MGHNKSNKSSDHPTAATSKGQGKVQGKSVHYEEDNGLGGEGDIDHHQGGAELGEGEGDDYDDYDDNEEEDGNYHPSQPHDKGSQHQQQQPYMINTTTTDNSGNHHNHSHHPQQQQHEDDNETSDLVDNDNDNDNDHRKIDISRFK